MEYISKYTRKQAIEDGVLFDMNTIIPRKESGINFPVACTSAVYEIIKTAVNNKNWGNDYQGVIWDIFTMFKAYARRATGTELLFKVIIRGVGRKKYHIFKAIISPGDTPDPEITIILPNDD